MREVREAETRLEAALSEVATVRKQFGYLDIRDPKLVYIGHIGGRSGCYRVAIPPGTRFLMHVTEMEFATEGWPENPEPTKTLVMGSWNEGADVVLNWSFGGDGNKRRFRVKTDSEELFDYVLENWKEGPLPNSCTYIVGPNETQKSFKPSETILLVLYKNDSTKRGVLLWMEPLANRYSDG